MNYRCDFLVLGSGIAGLTFAIKLANKLPDKKIVIASKSKEESSTKYAQGGIAAVTDKFKDSLEQHVQDTLVAGDGMCNREVVELVINEGSERIKELEKWGVSFDRESTGELNLHREGGHHSNRIVHHKDKTGLEVQNTLVKQIKQLPNIELLINHAAVDLIHSENICCGLALINLETHKEVRVLSECTLLATGGIGQIFSSTTNPKISTGDGIGMAIRAQVKTENLEFIQFHPTAFFDKNGEKGQVFLISEAVRGLGAKLINHDGHHFMTDYDKRADLAPRDIVSRAISMEMKTSGLNHVFLDCREIDESEFEAHFPEIRRTCLEKGINPSRQLIPVAPAAHYLCGGINTDEWGKTTMKNLYACGECACTGLHGANRLASNSLLEALVFAHRCYLSVINETTITPCEEKEDGSTFNISATPDNDVELLKLVEELRSIMSENIGVYCKQTELLEAKEQLKKLSKLGERIIEEKGINKISLEFRNMIDVSRQIVEQSISRSENRGVFYKE